MSDSIDRVFVKAISTIRALSSRSNYGSLPRPPAENRIKLYGLYKQATEGDVEGIMPRPIGFTREDEGAKKKWDAWSREAGLSKTEAKRRYISYLIETMQVYASGTLEARELLGELEYLWDQIKDTQFESDDEVEENLYPLPSRSPSFSQGTTSQAAHSDRVSNSGTPNVPNQQYRNNLQKIYSHSRRNTMSVNDYTQQQRQQQAQYTGGSVQGAHHVAPGQFGGHGIAATASVYSMSSDRRATGPPPPQASAQQLEDFKAWQGEVNTLINKLTREIVVTSRSNRSGSIGQSGSQSGSHREQSSDDEDEDDWRPAARRRIIHILKFLGKNALHFLRNLSVSIVAILFLVWMAKKNVIVERTFIKQPIDNSSKQRKELLINMIINTDENKWFVRLLSFVNSFVGFV